MTERPSFDPRKIITLMTGFLLVFSALVSGGIYPWSRSLFAAAVVIAFALSLLSRGRPALERFWPAWALLGVTYISSLWTISINDTLGQAFSLTAFALFAYMVALTGGGGGRRKLVNAVFIAAALVSIYAIYQYFVGFSHTEEYLRESGAASGLSQAEIGAAMDELKNRRAFSTLLSPNVLACYLAMVFPVGMWLYHNAAAGSRKVLYGLFLLLVFIAMVLTKSVGGLIALLSGAVIYMAARKSTSRSLGPVWRMVAAVSLAMLLAAGGYFVLSHRLAGSFGVGTSITERLKYWDAAVKMTCESPALGSGPGSYAILFPKYNDRGVSESRYAHNLLLQTLAETGVLGLAALVLLIGHFFYRCIKKCTAGGERDAIAPAILAGGTAFFVHNLVDFAYYVPETAVLFWFYFGLSASGDGDTDAGTHGGATFKAVLLVMVLTFGFFYAKSYLAGQRQEDALALLKENGITNSSLARQTPPPAEALRLAREAVELKPYDDSYHGFLAGLYEGMAVSDGPAYLGMAEKEYAAAIRLNPYYAYYYRDLGLLYLRLGDKGRARSEFRKALLRYPSNAVLRELLGSTGR